MSLTPSTQNLCARGRAAPRPPHRLAPESAKPPTLLLRAGRLLTPYLSSDRELVISGEEALPFLATVLATVVLARLDLTLPCLSS